MGELVCEPLGRTYSSPGTPGAIFNVSLSGHCQVKRLLTEKIKSQLEV